jgi:8-oxo-dGTP pyrophosphatase MutT (NUDIX family)
VGHPVLSTTDPAPGDRFAGLTSLPPEDHPVGMDRPRNQSRDQRSDQPRDRLRDQLRHHRAGDPREALSIEIMLSELGQLERPFDRMADLTHVTASGVVVGRRGVVLHRHRRLQRWMQPGGHLDPGETPEEAVVRECREETGLAVAHPAGGPVLVHVDVHHAAQEHVHLDLRYLMEGSDEDPHPGPDESQDVAWFTWDEATAMADEALVGALRSARRLEGAPGSGKPEGLGEVAGLGGTTGGHGTEEGE